MFKEGLNQAEKKGILLKRSDFLKEFRPRYFVLKGNQLYYFKEEQDVNPLGCISLVGASISPHEKKKNTFIIKHSGKQKDVLAANSQEDCQAWMNCISAKISKSPPLVKKPALKISSESILDQISQPTQDTKTPVIT